MNNKTAKRKTAWKYMSLYCRLRDCLLTTGKRDIGRCISCGVLVPIEEANAGHFEHGDNMDFVEKNINLQCIRCNHHLSGNLGRYAIALDRKYGKGTCEQLFNMKHIPQKYTDFDFEQIKEKYKKKYQELCE